MAWKAQGGNTRLQKDSNLHVNTIVTDKFVLKDYFYGDLNVQGNITTDLDLTARGNVYGNYLGAQNIYASQSICGVHGQFDYISANTDIYAKRRLIVGATDRDTNVASVFACDTGGNFTLTQSQITNHNLGTTAPFYAGKFGINAAQPVATLDIFGTCPQSLNIRANNPVGYSVLASTTKSNTAIVTYTDSATASLFFFANTPYLSNGTNPPSAATADARLSLDTLQQNIALSSRGSLRIQNQQGCILSPSINATHRFGESLSVYDLPTPSTDPQFGQGYLYSIYENNQLSCGEAATFNASNPRSVTNLSFLSTDNKGYTLSCGSSPQSTQLDSRMLSFVYRDPSGISTPSAVFVSNPSQPLLRNTCAINNPSPTIGQNALEVTGNVLLRSGEARALHSFDFEIRRFVFHASYPKLAIVFGEPYSTSATGIQAADGTMNYLQKVGKTTDGGVTWSFIEFSNYNIGYGHYPFTAGCIADNHFMVITTSDANNQSNFTFYSFDQGNTWMPVPFLVSNIVNHSVQAFLKNSMLGIYRTFLVSPDSIGYFDGSESDFASGHGVYNQLANPDVTNQSPTAIYSIRALLGNQNQYLYVLFNDRIVAYDSTLLTLYATYTLSFLPSSFSIDPVSNNLVLSSTSSSQLVILDKDLVPIAPSIQVSFVTPPQASTITAVNEVFLYSNQLAIALVTDSQNKKQICYSTSSTSLFATNMVWRLLSSNDLQRSGLSTSWQTNTSKRLFGIRLCNPTDFQFVILDTSYNYNNNQTGTSRFVYGSFPALFSPSSPTLLQVENANVSANGFITPSDKRLKTNLRSIENALDLVGRVDPCQFDWIESGKADAGFIAQDVVEELPHLTQWTNPSNPYLALDYSKLVPYLWKAVQELREEVRLLKSSSV